MFLGDPIKCWSPLNFTADWIEYTNQLCWNVDYLQDTKEPTAWEPYASQFHRNPYKYLPMILLLSGTFRKSEKFTSRICIFCRCGILRSASIVQITSQKLQVGSGHSHSVFEFSWRLPKTCQDLRESIEKLHPTWNLKFLL